MRITPIQALDIRLQAQQSLHALWAALMGGLICLCGMCRAGDRPSEPSDAQGVSGKVVKLSGNFMPGPGPARGGRTPLSVPVHIFRGKVKTFEKPDPGHPALAKIVQADKDGNYRCSLPPGEYTVVAEIDGKLYLNLFTFDEKDPCWGTVQVVQGKWSSFNIEDTSSAVF